MRNMILTTLFTISLTGAFLGAVIKMNEVNQVNFTKVISANY